MQRGFRQERPRSVPLGIRSPHRRSAPTESDKDAPPSVALSPTPLGLLSPSLIPGAEAEPCMHQTIGIISTHTHVYMLSFKVQHGCIQLKPQLDTLKLTLHVHHKCLV